MGYIWLFLLYFIRLLINRGEIFDQIQTVIL